MTDRTTDDWDQIDAITWHQSMPPRSMDEQASGETDTLFITKDGDLYWMKDPNALGANDYPSLEAAKAASQHHLDALWDALPAKFAKEAGLDPEIWHYTADEQGQGFADMDGDLLITRNSATEWVAFAKTEVGTFESASAAAEALLPTPKP